MNLTLFEAQGIFCRCLSILSRIQWRYLEAMGSFRICFQASKVGPKQPLTRLTFAITGAGSEVPLLLTFKQERDVARIYTYNQSGGLHRTGEELRKTPPVQSKRERSLKLRQQPFARVWNPGLRSMMHNMGITWGRRGSLKWPEVSQLGFRLVLRKCHRCTQNHRRVSRGQELPTLLSHSVSARGLMEGGGRARTTQLGYLLGFKFW